MPNIDAQALYSACYYGDAAAVSRLLPAGGTRLNLSGPAFRQPRSNSTPLMAAAVGGHTEIVRLILERAPTTDVDHADATRSTALMAATQFHRADIIRLLTDRGANVNLTGERGFTMLRLAVGQINPNSVQ